MRYGTIIEYFPDKQFGFIKPDAGKDLFFHISVVEGAESLPEVKIGQAVKFESMPREQPPSDVNGEERQTDRRQPQQMRAKVVVFIDKLPGGKMSDANADTTSAKHRKARKKKPTWRR